MKARGIEPVIGNLDDPEIVARAAEAADAVIHAASADHPGSVVTLVSALERSGKTLICTTGSGIAADSADGEYAGSVVFTEDTYLEPVAFRRPRVAMNRFVRQAAIDKGIRSIVICPSMIYGPGEACSQTATRSPSSWRFQSNWARASISARDSIAFKRAYRWTSSTCMCWPSKRLREDRSFSRKTATHLSRRLPK